MNEKKEDRLTVYEIGYLIADSIPEDKIGEEVDKVKKILGDANASVISEEAPHIEDLAYTIRKKTVAGSYNKYDKAYFGWVKFEIGSSLIENIKNAVEVIPSIIRVLVITTVRENTYLGKHAPAISLKSTVSEDKTENVKGSEVIADSILATPEEIDKSIDAMVKEA